MLWEKITSADFLFRDVDKLITNFQKEPTLVCICHLGYSLTNNSTKEIYIILRLFLAIVITPSIPEIIWVKNVRAIVVCGFLMKYSK